MTEVAGCDYSVTYLTGTCVFESVKFDIQERRSGPWWWRTTEFWVGTEFARLGPFRSRVAASAALLLAKYPAHAR